MHQQHLIRAAILVLFVAILGLKLTGTEWIHFYEVVQMPPATPPRFLWLLIKAVCFFLFAYLLYRVSVKADPVFPLVFWLILILLFAEEAWFYHLVMTENFYQSFLLKSALAIFFVVTQFFLFKFDKKLAWYFVPVVFWCGFFEWFLVYQFQVLNES